MAKKKEYYIPKVEVTIVQTKRMMWDLEGSGSKGQAEAPMRRDQAY